MRDWNMSLCKAVIFDDCTPKIIQNMVQENPDTLNSINELGCSALHNALTMERPIELIQELLKLGADVNLFGNHSTPLHYALYFYSKHKALYDVVKLLIKYGSNVNLKSACHHTPIHSLLKYVKGNMLIETLDVLLRSGVNIDHVTGNFTSYLEHACSFVEELSSRLEVSRMLLEFGVKPDKHRRMQEYNMNFEGEIDSISIQFIKLLMQYILINEIKNDIRKEKGHDFRKQYDKILNLNEFSGKKCFGELNEYRKCLIKELMMMQRDKMTEKVILFSFISERCSSSLHYEENEELILFKVISLYNSNRYVCFKDLFRASIKREALMSVIPNVCIYARKPIAISSSEAKVTLTSDAVLEIASYLTRQDALNLTLAYWIPAERNERFQVMFMQENH